MEYTELLPHIYLQYETVNFWNAVAPPVVFFSAWYPAQSFAFIHLPDIFSPVFARHRHVNYRYKRPCPFPRVIHGSKVTCYKGTPSAWIMGCVDVLAVWDKDWS